uniref:Reverse transcriptase domain-containing protein n=1 Tax=Heterorhabditis bacteriophora TaxID=37862 RepID=A0A1I7WHJ3_HETBA
MGYIRIGSERKIVDCYCEGTIDPKNIELISKQCYRITLSYGRWLKTHSPSLFFTLLIYYPRSINYAILPAVSTQGKINNNRALKNVQRSRLCMTTILFLLFKIIEDSLFFTIILTDASTLFHNCPIVPAQTILSLNNLKKLYVPCQSRYCLNSVRHTLLKYFSLYILSRL